MLADEFNVQVQSVEDMLAHPPTHSNSEESTQHKPTAVLQAFPTTYTIEHDMTRKDAHSFSVHNA